MNIHVLGRRAILAALLLLVPTLAVAQPIMLPPTPEQLVEGHTVFATLETSIYGSSGMSGMRFGEPAGETASQGDAPLGTASLRVQRFPGVLWFNDQYLVNPDARVANGLGSGVSVMSEYAGAVAVLVRQEEGFGRIRHPCGGAVLAVGAGDPDPRLALASLWDSSDSGQAILSVDDDGGPEAHSDTALEATGLSYVSSYLITDPTDRPWVIDRYDAYTRVGTESLLETTYSYPVWVVNIGGGPAFVPDDARSNCPVGSAGPADPTRIGGSILGVGASFGCGLSLPMPSAGPARDAPCMGYAEPSRNGACYGGQPAWEPCGDAFSTPERAYSALLYFPFDALVQNGAPRDHSTPDWTLDTNGCQTGTEWVCPAWDDDAEGNSHSFHPIVPPHYEMDPCPVPGSANPTNHAGSTSWGACDYVHATRQVDLYFSGDSRPLEPALRSWEILDLDGSMAPFADFHSAYPNVS